MKRAQFRKNIVFGLFLYLAMLMIIGSLDQLGQSFFSQEAMVIVLLTYLNHEWSVFSLGKARSQAIFTAGNPIRLLLYISGVIIVTIIITSLATLVYFIFIIKYFHFLTELITLMVLMVLFQILIHMYYIGKIHIEHLHAISMEQEEIQKEQLEGELENFEYEMNPRLLMECFETLISLIHRNIQDAEKYIQSLSDHYRYLLLNRHREIVELDLEIKSMEDLVYLLGKAGENKLSVDFSGLDHRGIRIIPGTLGYIVFYIVNNMIISPISPIKVTISLDGEENLTVVCKNRPRLAPAEFRSGYFNRLNQSYNHYTGVNIEVSEVEDTIEWKVPHLPEIIEG